MNPKRDLHDDFIASLISPTTGLINKKEMLMKYI